MTGRRAVALASLTPVIFARASSLRSPLRGGGLTGRRAVALASLTLGLSFATPVPAEQQSRVMPLEQVKQILETTKDSWVAFRNYDGRQLYYMTHLISWRCGIREVRFSENSEALDRSWPLPPCNKMIPNEVPGDAKIHATHEPGAITTLAVQVEFDDGTVTPVRIYEPCEGVGESTCGYLKAEQ